eukprot:309324-Amorphochlora_amoeboformis.AAC.2
MESKGSDGIFDGVLGIEAEMRTRGWEEGYTVGREKGIAEGKDLVRVELGYSRRRVSGRIEGERPRANGEKEEKTRETV